MTTEVDQIEERLRGPVNCWLNNVQQTDFARLLALARQGESALIQMARMARSERQAADSVEPTRVYDRPPTLPTAAVDPAEYSLRNRPGSSYESPPFYLP